MTSGQPGDLDVQETPHTTSDEDREQKVSWLELFFDLIFVVAFDQLAKRLGDAPTLENIVAFTLLFMAVWWAWAGNALLSARYGNESRPYRWGTVLELISMTMIAIVVRGDLKDTGWMFAAAFGLNRVIQGLLYLRLSHGPFGRHTGHGTLLIAALWLGSALLPSGSSTQFGVWVAALLLDLLLPFWTHRQQDIDLPHEEHLPERLGLLQIIALGAVITEVMSGSRQQQLNLSTLLPAFTSILTVVALWRLYFDQARALPLLRAHLEGRLGRLRAWLYAHLPFTLSVVMLGVGLGHGISDTDPHKDATNQQFVVWPLLGALLTLTFLRLNSVHVARRPVLDRSLGALLLSMTLIAALAFLDLDTLQTHLTVAGVTVLCAVLVALDPATKLLGKIEEKVNEKITSAPS